MSSIGPPSFIVTRSNNHSSLPAANVQDPADPRCEVNLYSNGSGARVGIRGGGENASWKLSRVGVKESPLKVCSASLLGVFGACGSGGTGSCSSTRSSLEL